MKTVPTQEPLKWRRNLFRWKTPVVFLSVIVSALLLGLSFVVFGMALAITLPLAGCVFGLYSSGQWIVETVDVWAHGAVYEEPIPETESTLSGVSTAVNPKKPIAS